MRTVARFSSVAGLCVALLWMSIDGLPAAATDTGFVSRTFVDSDGEHQYAVYLPRDYSSDRPWPVVLYLHGAGFSGADGRRQTEGGLGAVIRSEGDFPAIVVFPQSEDSDSPLLRRWTALGPDGRRAIKILEEVERAYAVDPARRILAGWSMGGYGAWSLAAAEHDRWSAVVAVSGGGSIELAPHITAPVWAIHGGADRAIPPLQSEMLVDSVNQAGGRAVLSVLPGVGHDAWRYAFLSQAVRDWMLAPAPGVPDTRRLESEVATLASSGRTEALDGEFRPALIIPRAISVRIGNDALRTLAYGAPAAIDPQMLSGRLNDLEFDFTAAGELFHITQEQVAYDVHLHRVLIEAQASGVVRLRVGLQPLTITIGATHVRSPTRVADAGPIAIRLGHRYPLWVDLVLRPSVSAGRFLLSIDRAGFEIPDANWLVTAPEDVTVTGPDLTPELVRIALQGGLYTRRAEIEKCVRDFLPELVERLEERLQPSSVDRIVATIWPMPVFRPRLRLQPDAISVDGDGMSLVLNLAAASFNAEPRTGGPIVTRPMGPQAAELPHSRALELGIEPGVLQALSGMIVDAHAAHIDVRDMPEPEFALLGDRAELNRILPELARRDDALEVRTELDLAAPFVVERADSADTVQFTSTAGNAAPGDPPDTLRADFEIPRLIVAIHVRDRTLGPDWRPYAEFDVRLAHSAALQLNCGGSRQCQAELRWTGQPTIDVAGGYVDATADANAAIDRRRLAELVNNCWSAWTDGGAVLQGEIPDLSLGDARLRIETLQWRGAELVARYRTPETHITNSGSRLIDYAVRGPYSDWSPRRQLQPGETDVYAVPSSLLVRRFPEPANAAIQVPVGGELDLAAPPNPTAH